MNPPTLRDACAADLSRIAELYQELHVDGPPPGLPPDDGRYRLRVAVDTQGAVVGYTYIEVDETTEIPIFLRHLVTAPEARGRGVARVLVEDAARGRAIQLNTDREGPNGAFYEHLGFAEAGHSEALRIHFRDVDAMPVYACITGPLAAERLASFAAAFALPVARVTPSRASQVALGAWDEDGTPLGFALFDRAFPGCFPFRVARPAAATELLREVERHAGGPSAPSEFAAYVGLMVEDDEPTAGFLRAFGAESRLRLRRYWRPAV